MNTINVIQIIDSLSVGGAEILAVNIANELYAQNINSHICVTRSEGDLKNSLTPNVGYVHLNKKRVLDFKAIRKLKNYIKKNNIKIIHAHSSSFFIAVCTKLIYPKVKIVWHDHFGNSEFLNKRKTLPLKLSSLFFSVVIAVNKDLKNWSLKYLFTKKIFFVRNFPVFNNLNQVTKLKGVENKKIVHIAGYREQKDHLNLLEAFKKKLVNNKDWTLHLIGKDYADNYSKKINDFIKDNGLSSKVFQYGVCSDIKYIISQATICVLSSKSEGLPISLLEYALAQKPVVVTNVGECNLIVKDKRYIVPPSNSTILAKAINELICSNDKRTTLALEVHTIVKSSFSKENTILKLIKIYKENC